MHRIIQTHVCRVTPFAAAVNEPLASHTPLTDWHLVDLISRPLTCKAPCGRLFVLDGTAGPAPETITRTRLSGGGRHFSGEGPASLLNMAKLYKIFHGQMLTRRRPSLGPPPRSPVPPVRAE